MIEFAVAREGGCRSDDACMRFSVAAEGMLYAGSRRAVVAPSTCRSLVAGLGRLGFGFWVGCAPGVDHCFRAALASSAFGERTFVGCAFASRVDAVRRTGLFATMVVPRGLEPASALQRRTLYLVKRCCMAVVFPDDPVTGQWGRGSSLVIRATLEQLKPVFVVSSRAPASALHYQQSSGRLFGVSGFWAVPHPIGTGGPCDEPV